jgi:hypothetical protein
MGKESTAIDKHRKRKEKKRKITIADGIEIEVRLITVRPEPSFKMVLTGPADALY